jgi:hypothetical protein
MLPIMLLLVDAAGQIILLMTNGVALAARKPASAGHHSCLSAIKIRLLPFKPGRFAGRQRSTIDALCDPVLLELSTLLDVQWPPGSVRRSDGLRRQSRSEKR